MPAPAASAATVVVLRDAARGLELLMVRRHERSGDFPGLSVFPGGLVEAADADRAFAGATTGYDPDRSRSALGEEIEPDAARSLYIAACRELFEEAGLLLARREDGQPLGDDALGRASSFRLALQSGRAALHSLLLDEEARLALGELLPFARWITPEFQPRRWDARFFLVTAPERQIAACDGTETCEVAWLRAGDALAGYREGLYQLAPPTFRILEEIAVHETASAVFEASRAAGPPRPILPVPLRGAPRVTLLYPGDRDYPGGDGTTLNRIVLDAGRWRSERSVS